MSPKPFGKPVRAGFFLTRGVRFMIALWGAAIPAYILGSLGSDRYPTLVESPFFWPSAIGFIALYAATIVRWLRHRPQPHGPWATGCLAIGFGRLLLALIIAAPAGFASAVLYEPTFKLANGTFATGPRTTEHAMVVQAGPHPSLDLLYATPPHRWKVREDRFIPGNLTAGSLATLTVRPGFLGAEWVENVEYEILK